MRFDHGLRLLRSFGAAAVVALSLSSQTRAGDLDITVTFEDLLGLGQPYLALIEGHLDAALDRWGMHLDGHASFEVLVRISPDVYGVSAASTTSGFVGVHEGAAVFEQGMAFELRTGVDPNGSDADMLLEINAGVLRHALWFDPDPTGRGATVDHDRIDAVSVFIHEIGHALAFNGWGSARAMATLGAMSTWDRNISFESGTAAFHGPRASALYGDAVPLTHGFDFHIGNVGGPGEELVADVMNGVDLLEGTRYDVSALDIAMLQDMGVPVASPAPEPSTFAFVLTGLAGVALAKRRRRVDGRTPAGSSFHVHRPLVAA
jgi:hypothetical protein